MELVDLLAEKLGRAEMLEFRQDLRAGGEEGGGVLLFSWFSLDLSWQQQLQLLQPFHLDSS